MVSHSSSVSHHIPCPWLGHSEELRLSFALRGCGVTTSAGELSLGPRWHLIPVFSSFASGWCAPGRGCGQPVPWAARAVQRSWLRTNARSVCTFGAALAVLSQPYQ